VTILARVIGGDKGSALATLAKPGIRNTGRASIVVAVGVALAAAVLALLLSSPASSAQDRAPGTSTVLGTNGASAPKISWRTCPKAVAPGRYQCATARVPLSYRKPDGKKITLALGRLPATNQRGKIGTLFWNPGGPGGSGRIPPAFSRALHQRFDIVGFDPRGTNASTPLKCFSSNRQAIETFGRPFPATLKQVAPFFAANERGTRLCDKNAGPIISHMSTANVARDMDLLRRAVGDEKLTYLGFSYGTILGSTYANLFPGKVRAMTLDAVLDPKEWTTGEEPGDAFTQPFTYRIGSFDGSQDALETFLQACANAGPGRGAGKCAFAERGAGPNKLQAKYERILARLRQEPVKVTDGGQTFRVTYQDAVGFTASLLYDAQASPFLARFLEQLHEATGAAGGRTKQGAAAPEVDVPDVPSTPAFERPEDRAKQPPPYFGLEWFLGVSCLDSSNPPTIAAWPPYARLADTRAPGFGALWTYFSTPCATWPAEDRSRYQGPWNKETANPLLLIGNRLGDPATPYDDARTTATRRLADARLLTLDSFGHTASYGGQSRCIDAAVDRYLVEGKLPPKGKVCQPNRGPFAP
jgi:pimeloyl-ACP methyl ester carboxylesterase